MLFVKRLIFYVYTLALTLLALLLCLRVISADFFWADAILLLSEGDRLAAGLSGAAVFLLGVWALFWGIFSGPDKKESARYTLMDNVHVSLDAIESFIEKTAKTVAGVREAKVKVTLSRESEKDICAAVNITAGQDVSITEVIGKMQELIQKNVQHTLGIELTEVKIVVGKISNDVKLKSRVQ